MAATLCTPTHEELFNNATGSNTGVFTFTVPADCTFLIIAVSSYAYDANYLSNEADAMRFNDTTNMTKGYITDASVYAWMGQLFYLANPTTGSVHVDWNFKGTTGPDENTVCIYSIYLKGVNTSDPVRSSGGEQQGHGTQYETGSLSAQTGDMAIMFAWSYYGSNLNLTWNPGSELSDDFTGHINSGIAYHEPTTGTNYIMDTVGDDGGISVLVLKPSSGSAAVTGPFPVFRPDLP